MLTKLHIQNYAIIDEIDINFSSALNIITGETGAGKSILMGALNLILGERADTSVLLNTNKKCFIEGFFSINNNEQVKIFLKENDIDETEELIVRREIAATGKSRAFINDSPATLIQLKQVASLLVDLHQQFDTLALRSSHFQREVLDALANNFSILAQYQTSYYEWQQAKQALEHLLQQKNNFNKETDYNQFLFEELNDANFKENELEDLDTELQLLNNSEGIKNILNKIYFDLKESETPIVTTIKQLTQQLSNFANYHTDLPSIIERLQSAQIELQDIAEETERINNIIGFDEARIDFINERIALGYKLLKKHQVKTTADLLLIYQELNKKLQAVLQIDETIASKEKEVTTLYHTTATIANTLSQTRHKEVSDVEKKVNQLLAQVGMPNAKLKINIQEVALNNFGKDNIEFLFDANKSQRFEPIYKVASGGELSRLMLCIKSLVAQSINLPTMIFDEIDTGISGEAAKQVGTIMKQLSEKRQIICITHQPQIAGKASAHYFVYKEADNNTIKTNIRLLNKEERMMAIAKMLGGEKPSSAALESAKEMMS
ncbi:MAG: DNA repair protein RecN [Chitinophagaceae bacterium]|nr:DNA repair protein RecN [Chitinophagaceae bacterium]MCW5905588.1 DNA repair protein RecN [Chitinophagaceae bacterium]